MVHIGANVAFLWWGNEIFHSIVSNLLKSESSLKIAYSDFNHGFLCEESIYYLPLHSFKIIVGALFPVLVHHVVDV